MVSLSSQALAALASGALAVSLGGGAVCLADHSIPGNALYSVKTSLGEPLKAAVALSPAAKVKVANDKASDRLSAAGDLAVNGDLTPDLADKLSLDFQNAVNSAQKKIADLADVNPSLAADLAAQQQAMFSSQGDQLASLGLQADAATQPALSKLSLAARTEADAAKKLQIAIDAQAKGTALKDQAQAALSGATQAVADAKANAAAAKSSLSAAANADLTAQLTAASHALANGQAQLDAGAFVQANDLLNSANRLANEASIYADAMANLKATSNLQPTSVLNAVKAKGNAGASVGGSAAGTVEEGSVGAGASGAADEGVNMNADGLLPDTGIELNVDGNVIDSLNVLP